MYEYSTFDSKAIQTLAGACNNKAKDGWELIEAVAAKDRFVLIFRRPKSHLTE